jgi:multiple sugar transport system ATP-binding protein
LVKLRLEEVSKKFGNTTVVDGSSFEVNDKEFFIILGPSGCGKTTTLNMIAGLEEPTSGKIFFDDQVVNDLSPEKRDIAMVFQTFALYPNLSVRDNIAFPLKLRKMKPPVIKEKVDHVCEKLRITHLMSKKPYQLSGGERQRVALARAIVREPKIFLLDEPLSNIDAKLRVHMRAELIALQKELQITTIYVTHDQIEAMTMADKVMVMNHSKISQIGEPLEVFHKPANLFVAGFMGTPPMNFFNCSLKGTDGHHTITNEYFSISVPEDLAKLIAQKSPGGDLVLGVRPQDMGPVGSKTGDGVFDTEVYAVEPLGTETIVDVKLGEMIYKFVGPAIFTSKMGDKIRVQINSANMHIFDKKTEIAIA